MRLLRALLTGFASGLGVFVAGALAGRLHLRNATFLAMLCVPLALLAGASLFGASTRRWPARVVDGGLGVLLSAAAAISAVFYLRERHDWLDYNGDQGGDLYLLLLACFAAVPGGAAAAAPRVSHGFGLALGFLLGVVTWMAWLDPINPGYVILMAIGVAVGTLVCLVRRPGE